MKGGEEKGKEYEGNRKGRGGEGKKEGERANTTFTANGVDGDERNSLGGTDGLSCSSPRTTDPAVQV